MERLSVPSVVLLLLLLRPSLSWAPPHRSVQCNAHARTSSTHWMPRRSFAVRSTSEPSTPQSQGDEVELNEIHSRLSRAIRTQDFMEAGRWTDMLVTRLFGDDPEKLKDPAMRRVLRRRTSWKAGAASWLVHRLEALDYTCPTPIQINAMEAVQAVLNPTGRTESTEPDVSLLSELTDKSGRDMGVVISGATGSGKTLSYLVPMLSALSESLFQRERIRVDAEKKVGDAMGDLVDRLTLVTSPQMRTSSRKQLIPGGIAATGAALASLGETGSDVTSPLSLIVVPSKELGIQVAMLLYKLVGGSMKETGTEFVGEANFFKFKGPKGVRVACVFDDEEFEYGLKFQTDIVIAMPQYIKRLIEKEEIKPSMLRTIVFDEADLDLEMLDYDTLTELLEEEEDREYSRVTFLVGASVTKALGSLAVSNQLIPAGRSYIATAKSYAPLAADSQANDTFDMDTTKTASLTDLDVCLQPGLRHERAIYRTGNALLALTRLIRKELELAEKKMKDGKPWQRPRVVIFFPDEASAKQAIEPLRDALWGDHWVCVLLPKTGARPLSIMEEFKMNKTSVMLATPNSIRGLDFPGLTHVYAMFLPVDDPREYVHLAGRVGRIGQLDAKTGNGAHVVSVVSEEEASKVDELAKSLGFEFTDIEVPSDTLVRTEDGSVDVEQEDVEKLRRYLEDAVTFSVLEEEPTIDPTTVTVSTVDIEDEEEDEDEVDDDDDDIDEAGSFQ